MNPNIKAINIKAIKEVTENLTVAFIAYLIEISGFALNIVSKSPFYPPKYPEKTTEYFTLPRGHHVSPS